MTSLHIQRLLALIFLLLGAWCLIFPGAVERLVLRPEFQIGNHTSELLISCFGAQAMLVGTVIWMAKFTPQTFVVFGLLASLPFFIFNAYFYFVEPMFTEWMLLDFIGNVAILATSLWGYRLSIREAAVQATQNLSMRRSDRPQAS